MFHTSLVRKQLFRNIFICFTIFILFLNPYQSFCLAQIDSDKYHFLHTNMPSYIMLDLLILYHLILHMYYSPLNIHIVHKLDIRKKLN